jgi:hypothetical protein
MGHMLLILVDSYSKWLEVFPMKTSTSMATITRLRRLFSVHGLPEHIVSDNGPQFVSSEFKEFLSKNGIKHTTSSPGHPATNGLAERYVGFVKKQLAKMSDKSDLDANLSRLLLSYRTTPHTSTGETPAALLMKRELRTKFSLLKPSLNQTQEKRVFDKNLDCVPKFKNGDLVFALNLRSGSRWIPGVIIDTMKRNYHVQIGSNVWRRHEDQLRPRSANYDPLNNTALELPLPVPTTTNADPIDLATSTAPNSLDVNSPTNPTDVNTPVNLSVQDRNIVQSETTSPIQKRYNNRSNGTQKDNTSPENRYPKRERHLPSAFKDYVHDLDKSKR